MNHKQMIEAVLFASGKPVSSKELAKNLDLPTRDVTRIFKELVKEYEERDGPIEISKTIRDEYVMQLKEEYTESAENYMPRAKESRALLKTLALIAYKQPIEQSKVVSIRGTSSYKHLKELEERNLILRKPKERSYIITTTKQFCELYSLKSSSPEDVRAKFKELLGGKAEDDTAKDT